MKKQLLMVPGPTQVAPEVYQKMISPMINHRGVEFEDAFGRVLAKLKRLISSSGTPMLFPGSGTGALEAAAVNMVSPGEEVVAVSIGSFGKRFAEILKRHGALVHYLEFPWGEQADPDEVRRFFAQRAGATCCFLTHNETSTGAINDLKALRQAVPEQVMLVVDAVSSLGAVQINQDDWGIDVLASASQKALMLPPGLAIVVASKRAMEKSKLVASHRYYWDFQLMKKFLDKPRPQTPYTPSVSLVLGLEAALDLIEEEGYEAVYRRHQLIAKGVREGCRAAGLETLAPEHAASPTVTAIKAPEGVEAGKITSLVKRKYGVVLAGGQDHLEGKVFRIGHMGYVTWYDALASVAAVEMAISELGVPVQQGCAAQALQKVIMEGWSK
ncbi:MAG: pyridoxal-phosphate-dependent aminotransferase family protein [Bacillota bacterium]